MKSRMKKSTLFFAALLVGLSSVAVYATPPSAAAWASDSTQSIQSAYANHSSHVEVEDAGHVIRLLPDDNNGIRHQKFIVKVTSGLTVLFAHNLDLAGRVTPLAPGDEIRFRGEYIWNPKGGVIHWTHRDPQGRHAPGWIRHNGNLYQ